MNNMTGHDWLWFSSLLGVGLTKLYFVARRTTPREILLRKPPKWQVLLLIGLIGFIVFLYVGPY